MLTLIVAAVIVVAFAYVLLAEEGDGPISRHLFNDHSSDAIDMREDRLG
jgi:hypothetical protein